MTPKLSIIVPTFNRERFLRSAVVSLLESSRISLEVIVVDDGSEDGSWKTLRDLPIRYLRNSRNRGLGFSRNRGVRASRGEYLAFLDSDDLCAPNALEQQIAFLESHPKLPVVGGMVERFIDETDSSIALPIIAPPEELSLGWLKQNFYSCGVWLYVFRKSVFHRVGLFDEGLVINDVEMMLRILRETPIPLRRIGMVSLRRHGGNISEERRATGNVVPRQILAESALVNGEYQLIPLG